MRPFVLVAVIVLAGCNSNGGNVPSQPAYDVDVRPILMAHCARCHGAGGTLNVPTEPTGPNAPTLPSISGSVQVFQALRCYLEQFGTTGDCTADGGALPASCQHGASTWATMIPGYLRDQPPDKIMPPPPAAPLDDWEVEILKNWATENPLICSHSASPDPTICPDGP